MSKFVGKFRKNENYSDDYQFEKRKRKNEHSESRKMLERMKYQDSYYDDDDFGKKLSRNR